MNEHPANEHPIANSPKNITIDMKINIPSTIFVISLFLFIF